MRQVANHMDTKRKIRLDVKSLTLGDLEDFEDACGQNLMDALTPQIVRDASGKAVPDPDDPKGRPLQQIKVNTKVMIGMVYLVMHKEDPSITLDDVKRLPLTDLDFDLSGLEDEPDPTQRVSDEDDANSD